MATAGHAVRRTGSGDQRERNDLRSFPRRRSRRHAARRRGRTPAAIRLGRSESARSALVMPLLIDIGNTRIKWARFEQGKLQPQSAAPHADWSASAFVETVLHSGGRCDRVLVSNVSGPRMADIVRSAVAQAWQVEPEFVTASVTAAGIHNAYPQPQQLGVDRWLAIIGAHALEHGALCVV